jgi:hypothetical protein
MKTAEEKAKKYADSIIQVVVSGTGVTFTVDDLNEFAQRDYLAGYNESMRWRDPEVDPPTNKDVVLVKTDNNCYATAYYHGKASGFITYGEDAYVEFGEIIGWRPI